MIIQGEFFQLIPTREDAPTFDLKLLKKIGGKNPREEYVESGYGIPIETAIKKCINYALSQKYETITLKAYLEEARAINQQIHELTEI